MVILTTDIKRFKLEFPNIYVLNFDIKSSNIQHEMMLNGQFKDNLCGALIKRYGVFACGNRWLLTDEVLKSHTSFVVDYGNSKEYNIQGYKSYFNRVPVLRDRVFDTYKEFCNYIQNNSIGVKVSHTMEDFGVIDILKILRDTGGFIMPSIEESIRIAMKELGIDSDINEVEDVGSASSKVEDDISKVEDTIVEEDCEGISSNSEEIDTTPDSTPAVYVKIKDGVAALIFSSNIEFQHKKLGNQSMNVLSFKMPDIDSEKLQELEVVVEEDSKFVKKSETMKKVVKRTPIITEDSIYNDTLVDLKNQKQAIDSQIKEARKEGNTDLVNSLRKQRRALRNKINSVGG